MGAGAPTSGNCDTQSPPYVFRLLFAASKRRESSTSEPQLSTYDFEIANVETCSPQPRSQHISPWGMQRPKLAEHGTSCGLTGPGTISKTFPPSNVWLILGCNSSSAKVKAYLPHGYLGHLESLRRFGLHASLLEDIQGEATYLHNFSTEHHSSNACCS